ncbi:hypothetical protein GCM10010211_67930 [Streptomyces albospinus]|uniref:Uncharacterized protein n=1 Tax=Streptomyces albospinus TaxID=285515 RepID=A0ABQ2VJN1_9ACTN|nr:hypothetical protein GCM10010211_67930 [Streptomyces albospinus]
MVAHAGAPVRKGDPVAVVETAKSTIADHRATDGAVGARCPTAGDRLLQSPEEL